MTVEWNGQMIRDAVGEGVREGLLQAGLHMQRAIRKNLNKRASNRGNGGQASPAGQPPANNTGTLSRSITIQQVLDKGVLLPFVEVGSSVEYAAIHEFGGIIRAKGRALTVPIHPDAKRASARGQSPRTAFKDAFVLKRKSKAPLLVRNKNRRGQLVGIDVLYVLAKQVVMPARPYMRTTFQQEKKEIPMIINRSVARNLAKRGVAA